MADYLSYTTVDGDTYDMIALDMYHDEYEPKRLVSRCQR